MASPGEQGATEPWAFQAISRTLNIACLSIVGKFRETRRHHPSKGLSKDLTMQAAVWPLSGQVCLRDLLENCVVILTALAGGFSTCEQLASRDHSLIRMPTAVNTVHLQASCPRRSVRYSKGELLAFPWCASRLTDRRPPSECWPPFLPVRYHFASTTI